MDIKTLKERLAERRRYANAQEKLRKRFNAVTHPATEWQMAVVFARYKRLRKILVHNENFGRKTFAERNRIAIAALEREFPMFPKHYARLQVRMYYGK